MAYKRRFSDEDADLMEQDAEAAGRITAAERRMALAGNSFNNRNNQIADLAAAARERRLASRSHFVTMNPGAVSPQERASLAQERLTGRERAIQDFERGMAQDRIAGEIKVSENKRDGMIGQGRDAAEANGRWGLEIEKQRGANALTLAEKEWAGKKEIADIGLKQHELEWGNGGGRERIARIEGGSRVDAARAQAEAAAEQNAQKNALEEQKRLAAAEKEKGRLKLQYDKLEQKDKAAVDSAANSLAKEKGISFEDARAQVMAGREQSQQQGGKKEVKRQRNPKTGQVRIVYDDGSTEIVNE